LIAHTLGTQSHWTSLTAVAGRVPHELLSWLAEPGLLTARVRALCGPAMGFRRLGRLREAGLSTSLRERLKVEDDTCLLREVEFSSNADRIVFAQTVLPASTVARYPWLRELGDSPLGEALRQVDDPLEREPLEYAELAPGHPLADVARSGDSSVALWARRAVYRLGGLPILVQEVFLPELLRVQSSARAHHEDHAMNTDTLPFAVPRPTVAIAGSAARFPVHRIYCVGRNYAAHAREMGNDPTREPPCFFTKPADAVVANGAPVRYPPRTNNLHHEVELVIAIGKGGKQIPAADALEHVFGYAVGNDLTRRDLQAQAKDAGLPWDVAKAFDHSAPITAISPVTEGGHVTTGRIWLEVNGQSRQDARLDELIWSVPEIVAELSTLFELQPGDLIFTGTPAGVGALQRGDSIVAGIDGLDTLRTTII
jgi:fumarylpyruvate hydrolase